MEEIMIKNYKGNTIFICDNCEGESSAWGSDFHYEFEWIKENGWLTKKKNGNEWEHFCSKDCLAEFYPEAGAGHLFLNNLRKKQYDSKK